MTDIAKNIHKCNDVDIHLIRHLDIATSLLGFSHCRRMLNILIFRIVSIENIELSIVKFTKKIKDVYIMDKIQEALNQAYAGESKAALGSKFTRKKLKMRVINKWPVFSVSFLFGRNSRRESLKGAPGNQGHGRKSDREF